MMMTQLANPAPRTRKPIRHRRHTASFRTAFMVWRLLPARALKPAESSSSQPASVRPTGQLTPVPPRPQ